MTKAGADHLKRHARELARTSGGRFPDVLAEPRRAPRPTTAGQPSKELVALCPHPAHPNEGGRCARPADHEQLDGDGTWWCSPEPHLSAHVWQGYHDAADAARRAQDAAAWLASLTPAERDACEAEQEAAYWADTADAAREPYDPHDDKYQELVLDALDEERRYAEPDDLDGDGLDAFADEETWDGAYR
ncbi:hypothetical protein ACFRDV_12640 [Streptomyces fagopyri]|uniref:hypothetical protein n=1 Tax=Streptomyces fagopyri TaxID=2662397 RepID=UPI0036C21E8A